jgi:ATP-dependent Clp protease ATP-binding subunit ClpA
MFFVSRMAGQNMAQAAYCLPCALEMNIGPIKSMLRNMGISSEEADLAGEQLNELLRDGGDEMLRQMMQGFPGITPIQGAMPFPSAEGPPPFAFDGDEDGEEEDEEEPGPPPEAVPVAAPRRGERKGKKDKARKYISLYCTDLTKRARDGQLDRVVGRGDEIARTMQILCRRSKNNPCLIGEPGVGKTAIAEGLARRIAAGDVPSRLSEKEIQLLDLTALVAGTSFRGQFESRIKGLIEEVKALGNIILFIDEVHSLVGAGDAEGSMNAANILKPALSRGEVQVIGATTFTEYRKYIEKDAALERRLQPVKIEEPSIEETCQILEGVKEHYESFHKVKVNPSIVRKAVVLSERYITDRFLPDKAIDLLDEACTCANLRNAAIEELEKTRKKIQALLEQQQQMMIQPDPDYEKLSEIRSEAIREESRMAALKEQAADNLVTEDDVARVIQLWTGIPAQKVMESDIRRLRDLEEALKKHIVGQDEAVAAVSAAIRRSRVQINPQRRPASFIFVGPTGVGKTELVKRLAAELFDKPETLIRLDMSEFMEKHAVSRIIGSPPGYIGYDEAGQLTEKVRRKPYSVILFDEIEKAHPDVMNILLQILDEGRIHDAQGREVGFENTVIIMTSNAGSERRDGAIGFGKTRDAATKERCMKALKDFLRPEFLGRVDEIVFFRDLDAGDFENIALLQLEELKTSLLEKQVAFTWTPEAPKALAAMALGGTRGARDLRNVLRRRVEDPITTQIVQAVDAKLSQVLLSEEDGDVVVTGM